MTPNNLIVLFFVIFLTCGVAEAQTPTQDALAALEPSAAQEATIHQSSKIEKDNEAPTGFPASVGATVAERTALNCGFGAADCEPSGRQGGNAGNAGRSQKQTGPHRHRRDPTGVLTMNVGKISFRNSLAVRTGR
jgi:hypothetical protein